MQRCLDLASLGSGQVAPNPMVGAVLVYESLIIGEGYHERYGGPHAEVNCINSVRPEYAALISKSTLYVSLEPCVHFGKTPPCTELIIQKKIPQVVVGCRDIFEQVDGKGIEKLRDNGINVITEVLATEARQLNRRFFTFHQYKRPYIILKWAQTNDGKISGPNNERLFISNEYTDRLVHKWRTEAAAIMVGTNTALLDDPALTARLWPGHDPVRIVIDKQLKLQHSLKLFDGTGKTLVFNQHKEEKMGKVAYLKIAADKPAIQQMLKALYRLELESVLVEGGSKLLQSFIDAGLWDEARIICNKRFTTSEGLNAPVIRDHNLTETLEIATDIINIYQHQF